MKNNLQRIRKERGYKSAREFAEKVGINVRTYTNYEQGTAQMSLAKAFTFARALGCSIDDLVSYSATDHDECDYYRMVTLDNGDVRFEKVD